MTSNKTLRAVHIGLSVGHAGSFDDSRPRLIHDFRRLENVDVVAYCEMYDPSFLDTAKKHHPEAGLYSSVDDLIANEEFDVACVVLHPRDVPDALLKLANAGKHFLVDKQFALHGDQLKPVVEAVNRNNLTTFLTYAWRFHPAMQDLKKLIDEGVMGKPIAIETRQAWGQVGGPHGDDPERDSFSMDIWGGGNLQYVGCHLLEVMRFLMGCEVKSVQAQIGRPLGYTEEGVEDIAVLALEYENGAYGSVMAGYLSPKGVQPAGSGLIFYGSEGWARWPSINAATLEVYSASPLWGGVPERVTNYTVTPFPSIALAEWFYHRIARFPEYIRAGDKGAWTMEDALYVQQSIDAAYESGRTGRRVEVKYGL